MFDLQNFLKQLRQKKTTATQGLNLSTPAAGQIHWPLTSETPDVFYLITEVFEDCCEIIPGSFDSMMACSDDIILPQDVFGDFVFLSLNLAATVPATAVGKGFARLDTDTYNRIIDSQLEYETGEKGENPSFAFAALPYASTSDPRKFYHDSIAEMIIKAQQKFLKENFEDLSDNIIGRDFCQQRKIELIPVFEEEEFVLAAGDEKSNAFCECYVDCSEDLITVEYELAAKSLRIKCYTPEDESSYFFDGWYVWSSTGKTLGIIVEGKLLINDLECFDGKLSLQDEYGYFYPLNKRGN